MKIASLVWRLGGLKLVLLVSFHSRVNKKESERNRDSKLSVEVQTFSYFVPIHPCQVKWKDEVRTIKQSVLFIQSRFSQMHKIGNINIVVNFVFP